MAASAAGVLALFLAAPLVHSLTAGACVVADMAALTAGLQLASLGSTQRRKLLVSARPFLRYRMDGERSVGVTERERMSDSKPSACEIEIA